MYEIWSDEMWDAWVEEMDAETRAEMGEAAWRACSAMDSPAPDEHTERHRRRRAYSTRHARGAVSLHSGHTQPGRKAHGE